MDGKSEVNTEIICNQVAGDFSDWEGINMRRGPKEDEWTIVLHLQEGR